MQPRRGLLVVLACVAWVSACSDEARLSAEPNILLVTLDTLRADRPGFMGNSLGLTPNLDALARESVVFENAVTTMATTFPAHASMFTGLVPSHHGVRWNGDTLAKEQVTLAELLRDHGYETAAFVALKAMLTQGGLQQGFSSVSDRSSNRSHWDLRSGDEVTALARTWLRGDRKAPWFLWVHYYGVHSPYRVTPYAAARLEGYDGLLAAGADPRMLREQRAEITASPEHLQALRTLYDGEVVEVDAQVGSLLRALHESGAYPNTVVAIASDHGQSLGEGQLIGHGGHVSEVVARVPLLIRTPGRAHGSRVATRVSVVDLAPTLLELAGVSDLPPVQGRSLVPALEGEMLPAVTYVVESKRVTERGRSDPTSSPAIAVYLANHKLVRRGGKLELYDVVQDPAERSPLAQDANARALEKGLDRIAAYERSDPAIVGTRTDELAPETIEGLRSLGYLE